MQSAFGEALASVEGQYSRASPKSTTDLTGAEPRSDAPTPTPQHLEVLVNPILKVMRTISCYEVMGNSTQVIVVDYDAPLTIAFVAAQESRVTSCSLWDANQQRFVGVMTISDYIRVLLHCSTHPGDVERVRGLTVRQWRELPESRFRGPKASATATATARPQAMVSALAEEALGDCISRMISSKVNRLPIFAPQSDVSVNPEDGSPVFPAGSSPSIVSLLTYAQVLSYLSKAIFLDDGSSNLSSGLAFSPATQAVLGASPPINIPNATTMGLPYSSIFDVPVGLLGFPSISASFKPKTMSMENKVVDALKCFIEDSVHALPIVDDRSIIIDIIARNDVMRLETGGMYDISKTLGDALSFRVGTKVTVFTRADTLRDVTLHFIATGVSVMFCVDDQDVVNGQLALVDIVKCFLRVENQPSSTGADAAGEEAET